jgi:hypothetical protein
MFSRSPLWTRRKGSANTREPRRATFVVNSASGVAVPVTEPFSEEEMKEILRRITPEMLAEVAEARHHAGIVPW